MKVAIDLLFIMDAVLQAFSETGKRLGGFLVLHGLNCTALRKDSEWRLETHSLLV